MLPFSVSGLGWQVQLPLLLGAFTLLWLALKLWRSVRERQIRIIPASWNGIHAHQWSLIQCLTHRATCCVCRSLIVDAMLCDSCGVCLDFTCYQSYISRFGASAGSLIKKVRGTTATTSSATATTSKPEPLSTLGVCKAVSTPAKRDANGRKEPVVEAGGTGTILGPHHWVHGNLPAHSKCFLCGDYCDDDDDDHGGGGTNAEPLRNSGGSDLGEQHTLHHYRCCWCQRTVHEGCFERHQNQLLLKRSEGKGEDEKSATATATPFLRCDYGKWRRTGAKEEGPADWEPLFVVANRGSGNADAGAILGRFLALLNPLQVIDLGSGGGSGSGEHSLELALQMVRLLPKGVKARFLVAGGDGTVGWVLNTVQRIIEAETEEEDEDEEDLPTVPPVAILPLGTGNDLARVLGWSAEQTPPEITTGADHHSSSIGVGGGGGSHQHRAAAELVAAVYAAAPISLDRWTVDIRPTDYYHRSRSLLVARLHIPRSIMPPGNRTLSMYNYLSVGVDALVTLNFHETRKSWLYKFLFTNTLVNKFLYFTYGTKDLWERRCANLQRKVVLELDGVPQGERDALRPQSVSDGLIEVYGLTGSFHIAQVIMGLASPIFIGQAREVRLTLAEHLPMQADGEPWLQAPRSLTWRGTPRRRCSRRRRAVGSPTVGCIKCRRHEDTTIIRHPC
ncbi:hypothetical protein TYRP_018110 [Tyrophagus putrescentiae]|nr:hypothetical protein TYRP_018110 [Tyrophagus putrescentiae]